MSDISYSKFLIKSKFNPKKAKKYMESYDKIMESGLFDKNYYLKAYPHIAKSGMDPLVHYLFFVQHLVDKEVLKLKTGLYSVC